LRVDKMTLAALAATLRLYRDPAQAKSRVPLLMLLSTPEVDLRRRAETLAAAIVKLRGVQSAQPVADTTFLGGGSIPTQKLPTWCVAIAPTVGLDALAADLRAGTPSVVGRVQDGRLLLDLRSVFPRQDEPLLAAVRASLERLTRSA
jgi:L-seryl-tRNA(Ser) seleniumtransferase